MTALAALAAFVVVMLLAAWPALHEAFHGKEASSASHQCVATLLAKSQVLVADLAVVAPVPAEVCVGELLAPASLYCPADVWLSPARAPPSLP